MDRDDCGDQHIAGRNKRGYAKIDLLSPCYPSYRSNLPIRALPCSIIQTEPVPPLLCIRRSPQPNQKLDFFSSSISDFLDGIRRTKSSLINAILPAVQKPFLNILEESPIIPLFSFPLCMLVFSFCIFNLSICIAAGFNS